MQDDGERHEEKGKTNIYRDLNWKAAKMRESDQPIRLQYKGNLPA